jgi:hypothetical protein
LIYELWFWHRAKSMEVALSSNSYFLFPIFLFLLPTSNLQPSYLPTPDP